MFIQFILGLLPIIWLIVALSGLKMAGYKACPIAIVFAAAVALVYKKMPAADMGTAALEGILNALWPILLVIIAALFTYNLTLKTGAMEYIKAMLASISNDKRILALIIGWGFGCFMEGMAGFGTAVAIPASILVALGFDPIPTVVGLLIVNSTPTAFGSVGVPISTLASVTEIAEQTLSSNTAIISALAMFLSPILMVAVIGKGVKALKGILPVVLISSLAFTIPNILIGMFVGPQLPDIIGSICSMVVTILLALKGRKKEIPEEYRVGEPSDFKVNAGEAARAWSPFILIAIVLLLTSKLVPFINGPLSAVKSSFHIYTGDPDSMLSFAWINTPGVLIIICAIIGGLIQKASFATMGKVFVQTLKGNVKTIITICSVLATAKIMQYSGMTMDVAETLVHVTGRFFPLLSPLVGVLGAFVTGSGTSTCVLFGPMQASTGAAIGLEPAWLASANALGAGIGKMLSPSNVAIGAAAAGLAGSENKLIGQAFKWALLMAVIGGLCCFFMPGMGIV